MADHSYTDTTNQSWFGRIGNALKGMLIGLLLFLGSFVMLVYNENRAIDTTRGLEQAQGEVIAVGASPVQSENNGKLVYFTAVAGTDEVLADDQFNISTNALVLRRNVEMYQWKEDENSREEKQTGGGSKTVTTYNYSKIWSSRAIDSSSFAHAEGHENPQDIPYGNQNTYSSQAKAGDFKLPTMLLEQLPTESPITPSTDSTPPEGFILNAGKLYRGISATDPQVGDLQVQFSAALPGPVSIIAKQIDNSLELFHTKSGTTVAMLKAGTFGADNMFAQAHSENATTTWIFRGVGFFMMFIGLTLLLKPLSVFADVLPILGTIVGMGTGIVAGLVAVVLTLVTIAIAWIAVRPLLAVGLLAVAGFAVYLLAKRKKTAAALRPNLG